MSLRNTLVPGPVVWYLILGQTYIPGRVWYMKRVIPDQHIFLQLWERCKSAKGPSLYLFSVACPINMYLVNPGHTLWLPGHICAHDYAHFGHVMHTRKHISNLHAQNAHNHRHKCVWACTHIFLVSMNQVRVHSEKRNAAEQSACMSPLMSLFLMAALDEGPVSN